MSVYTLKEKALIYGGALIGAVLPVTVNRYTLFNQPTPITPLDEVGAWLGSVAYAGLTFSLLAGTAAGLSAGLAGATLLQQRREKRSLQDHHRLPLEQRLQNML